MNPAGLGLPRLGAPRRDLEPEQQESAALQREAVRELIEADFRRRRAVRGLDPEVPTGRRDPSPWPRWYAERMASWLEAEETLHLTARGRSTSAEAVACVERLERGQLEQREMALPELPPYLPDLASIEWRLRQPEVSRERRRANARKAVETRRRRRRSAQPRA